ncbi:hypothetical protein [Polaromonas sp. JS666]|uniref:hypothetical protein n=1 Tax=Polaromonas sp. (strain JS666 / ATCC BAA-500) TaxID=296591 RepID=UPI0000537CD9|nr:hypothetical protein [Polaromonas sp. JS666]
MSIVTKPTAKQLDKLSATQVLALGQDYLGMLGAAQAVGLKAGKDSFLGRLGSTPLLCPRRLCKP